MSSAPRLLKPWGNRLLAFVIWAVLTALVTVAAWRYVIQPVSTALGNWTQARDFRPHKASVGKHRGRDAFGEFDWYSARYEIAGQAYFTNRLSLLLDEAVDELYNEAIFTSLAQAHATGRTVDVWAHPRYPEVAVITRDFPIDSVWLRMILAVGVIVFPLFGVAAMVSALAGRDSYGLLLRNKALLQFAAAWCGLALLFGYAFYGYEHGWIFLTLWSGFAVVFLPGFWKGLNRTVRERLTDTSARIAARVQPNASEERQQAIREAADRIRAKTKAASDAADHGPRDGSP